MSLQHVFLKTTIEKKLINDLFQKKITKKAYHAISYTDCMEKTSMTQFPNKKTVRQATLTLQQSNSQSTTSIFRKIAFFSKFIRKISFTLK